MTSFLVFKTDLFFVAGETSVSQVESDYIRRCGIGQKTPWQKLTPFLWRRRQVHFQKRKIAGEVKDKNNGSPSGSSEANFIFSVTASSEELNNSVLTRNKR